MPHIFISYAQKDTRQLAFALDDALNALEGVTSWVDRSIKVGCSWEMQIETEIDKCDFMVVLYSEDLHRHKKGEPESYVLTEIDYAKRTAKKMIIPVMAQSTYAPIMLTREQYIDYVGNGMDVAMLVEALCYEMNITMQPRNSSATPPKIETPIAVKQPNVETTNFLLSQAPPQIQPAPLIKTRSFFVPPNSDFLPQPFEWCYIPAGEVVTKAGGYLKNDKTFHVADFFMAKYPITNEQFDIFAQDSNGYKDPIWWDFSNEGKVWRTENAEPHNTGFTGSYMPRTNITWYEAVAFCRWLSAITNENIMIPTDQQWQRAAQGDNERIYPWGNKWDSSRCNNKVSRSSVGQTTPVNHYEGKGDSPFKVTDMAGNVWELCSTEYEIGEDNLQGAGTRILHGGSWYYADTGYFNTTLRLKIRPYDRSNEVGFRIAMFHRYF